MLSDNYQAVFLFIAQVYRGNLILDRFAPEYWNDGKTGYYQVILVFWRLRYYYFAAFDEWAYIKITYQPGYLELRTILQYVPRIALKRPFA